MLEGGETSDVNSVTKPLSKPTAIDSALIRCEPDTLILGLRSKRPPTRAPLSAQFTSSSSLAA